MLGFTLPLLIIMALEGVVGILLLCPKPLNQPAIAVARLSHTQVGMTVFHTLAVMLLLLLASPVYDGIQLLRTAKEKGDPSMSTDTSEQQARTLLSFTLTASCLAMMFFLRRLGLALGQMERMSLSEAALLKQVKGLQSEYTRMADSSAGTATAGTATAGTATAGTGDAGTTSAQTAGEAPEGQAAGMAGAQGLSEAEVEELRRIVQEQDQINKDLNSRLEAAAAARQQAESNLAALQTQSRGLENEYDRLLAEHDQLRKQLARSGLAGEGDNPLLKKEA